MKQLKIVSLSILIAVNFENNSTNPTLNSNANRGTDQTTENEAKTAKKKEDEKNKAETIAKIASLETPEPTTAKTEEPTSSKKIVDFIQSFFASIGESFSYIKSLFFGLPAKKIAELESQLNYIKTNAVQNQLSNQNEIDQCIKNLESLQSLKKSALQSADLSSKINVAIASFMNEIAQVLAENQNDLTIVNPIEESLEKFNPEIAYEINELVESKRAETADKHKKMIDAVIQEVNQPGVTIKNLNKISNLILFDDNYTQSDLNIINKAISKKTDLIFAQP